MKMNSLHQRKRFRRRRHILGMLVTALVLVSALGVYVLAPRAVGGAATAALSPVWSVSGWVGDHLSAFSTYMTSKAELRRRNAQLRAKLQQLELRTAQLDILEAQNQRLRTTWQRSSTTDGVHAAVRTRPPQSPYDVIVVDAGTSAGISVDDAVVYRGVALGTVRSVYENAATVRLFSTAGVETDAFITGSDTAITVRGAGGGTFRARVSKDVAVEQGDMITPADSDDRILARVVSVSSSPSDPQQLIRAQSPVTLNTVRRVIIMPKPVTPFRDE